MSRVNELALAAQSPRYSYSKLKDETSLVLDTVSLEVLLLNETAAFLWEGLRIGDLSEADLVSRLVAEFEVDSHTAASDVAGFLEELSRFVVKGDVSEAPR